MKDYTIRAVTENGEIRAFASTTKNMVEAAREYHNTTKVATAALTKNATKVPSWMPLW